MTSKEEQTSRMAFSFYPLRQISAHLFSRQKIGTATDPQPGTIKKEGWIFSNGGKVSDNGKDPELGIPTVMDVNGMIAVGTELGFVSVYGFSQDIRYVLGSKDSGECEVFC